jgi:hypothetical protein
VRAVVIVLAGLAALLLGAGCAKKPAVTVEQVHEVGPPPGRGELPNMFPPRCEELPTADYPDVPADLRPETVSVRVDLTIDKTGRSANLRATALDEFEGSAAFVEAALAATRKITCEPALRMPSPDADRILPDPVEYNSSVIYRFYRDEQDARATF